MQHAIVIYESLTGNTRRAGERISAELEAAGVDAPSCPITPQRFVARPTMASCSYSQTTTPRSRTGAARA